MSNMWTSPETFENDLFAFSEIEGVKDHRVTSTPQSLLEWEARNGVNQHRSIFDTPDFSEDVTYVVSGRGRGGVSTIIRPGAIPKISTNMDMDIKKKLREITGPGFSNALIEESFRSRNGNTITGAVSSDIKFQQQPPKLYTSNGSTPNNISRVQTPTNFSGHSALSAGSTKSPSTNSRCSSRISTSSEAEANVAVENIDANPMPLSAILKKARDVRKRALEKSNEVKGDDKTDTKKETETKENMQTNVDQNDIWWSNGSGGESYSWRRRDIPIPNRFFNNSSANKAFSRNLNISSTDEFPALK